MASTRLAFLAAATRSAPQGLCATVFGLAFLPGGVIEVIRFHCARQLAIGFVGDGRIAQPPAPARARTAMHPQLSRNTPRRTGQTQQEGGENPVHQRSLALVQEGLGEIVEGALAAVAPVAFAAWPVVIHAPQVDIVALAPGTLQGAIFLWCSSAITLIMNGL